MSYPLQADVSSSNIAKAGYDGESLYLLFNSGIAYRYPGVSQSLYNALVSADSVGSFFHRAIRNVFQHERLEAHQF